MILNSYLKYLIQNVTITHFIHGQDFWVLKNIVIFIENFLHASENSLITYIKVNIL